MALRINDSKVLPCTCACFLFPISSFTGCSSVSASRPPTPSLVHLGILALQVAFHVYDAHQINCFVNRSFTSRYLRQELLLLHLLVQSERK